MIHIQQHGSKSLSILLPLILLLISCNSYQFITNGRGTNDFYTYYCNDSLNLSLMFRGSLDPEEFKNKELSQKDKTILKNAHIKPKHTSILFSVKNSYNIPYKTIGLIRPFDEIELSNYLINKRDSLFYYYRVFRKNKNVINEALLPFDNDFVSLLTYQDTTVKSKFGKITFKSTANEPRFEEIAFWSLERISKGISECYVENPFTKLNDYFNRVDEGNYLAFSFMKHYEKNYKTLQEKSMLYQAMATYCSFAGETDMSNIYWSNLLNLDGKFVKDTLTVSEIPFKTKLINLAEQNQVIMFNEAHHKPQHRYLVGSLLKEFYEKGYRYLGLEALQNTDSLQKYGYPTLENGFYLREPSMANLVREALKIGYTVFGYDSWSDKREQEQAQNIYKHTIKINSEAKVIILAGYGHIHEGVEGNGKRMMAAQFNEISGINPLTINQTNAINSYMRFNDLNNEDRCFFTECNKWNGNDYYLVNKLNIQDNCFDTAESKKVKIEIPKEKLSKFESIICIYEKNESEKANNAIPVYIKILKEQQNIITTKLCRGNYLVKYKNYNGKVILTQQITVE